MTIREFLAYTSPGRSRVFAIDDDRPQFLEAVTSLGADSVGHTEQLLDGLNVFLVNRDEADLDEVLDELPGAVQAAVRDFLNARCPTPPPGTFGENGFISEVRLSYFSDKDELKEHLEAAWLIGLGVRMSNEIGLRGRVSWRLQLLEDEVLVPAGADPRTWALPTGVPLLSTWTSKLAKGNPLDRAFEQATEASAAGHWVRLHTFDQGDGPDTYEASRSLVRVDVFDCPIPG